MKCFLCNTEEMMPYFQKKLGGVERIHQYVRCPKCGIVIDETFYQMTAEEWKYMNQTENDYQGTQENPVDPRWIERLDAQAEVLSNLFQHTVLAKNLVTVDYGCGDGKLSDYVNAHYEQETGEKLNHLLIGKYDKYMTPEHASDYLTETQMRPGTFDFVVSCSVFEHLIGTDDIEEVVGLLSKTGTLAVHTLVCEEVPKDPDWYYLLHGHCTIWTNQAMQKFYEEHAFIGCAYHVESRMWFFFRDGEKYKYLQKESEKIDGTWVFSDRFVDYWKCKPYRE
jgi:cyclopropane fatty-acyl-phospholipid synthase-like methyltransferase